MKYSATGQPYLENSGLLPTYQSGFRTNHSMETALLSLRYDIYAAIDKSELSFLTGQIFACSNLRIVVPFYI